MITYTTRPFSFEQASGNEPIEAIAAAIRAAYRDRHPADPRIAPSTGPMPAGYDDVTTRAYCSVSEVRAVILAVALKSGIVDRSYDTTCYGRVSDYRGEASVRGFGAQWRVVGVKAGGDIQTALQGGCLITLLADAAQIWADHDELHRMYGVQPR